MSKIDKLIERFKQMPKDFTYDEIATLLLHFGYVQIKLGKVSGSAVKFGIPNTNNIICFHKPHPENTLKKYVLDQVMEKLKQEGLI